MPSLLVRTAAVAALTLLATAAAAGAAVDSPPTTSADDAVLGIEAIGTYRTGVFDGSAAEIVAFHPGTDRSFTVNAESGRLDVLDAEDPTDPTLVESIALAGTASGDDSTIPTGAVANSVTVRDDGLVVVVVESDVKTDEGWLAFLDAADLDVLGAVRVGALPDMVTLTPDGRQAVVANEGEPADDFSVDPEGSVGVVALPEGVAAPGQGDVRIADFRAWDLGGGRTLDDEVRVFGPVLDEDRRVSTNLEPEYVAVDPAGGTAWVALQEANAVAEVDLALARVTEIRPLGTKDHSVAGNGLDTSDRDDAIAIEPRPVSGLFMPDAMVAYAAQDQTYLVTANEGDAREWGDYVEPARVKDLGDDGLAPVCEDSPAADLTGDAELGRLNVSTASGLAEDESCYEELHAFGSRSFSIWSTDGTLVFDSGDELERIVAEASPEYFNSNHTESNFEGRSDDKGPEPESVTIGRVGERTYAFVGLERIGGIAAYDVTDPADARFVTYLNNRDLSVSVEDADDPEAVLDDAGDLGPEGVAFVAAEDSPTGQAIVLVGNEVSGTTTFFGLTAQFTQTSAPGIVGEPVVGEELTAEVTVWSPEATFAWQWLRDGEPIDGATSETYTPTDDDAGAELTVRATGSAPSHADTSRTSEPVTVSAADDGDDGGSDDADGDTDGDGDGGVGGVGDGAGDGAGEGVEEAASGGLLPDAGAPAILALLAMGLVAVGVGVVAMTHRTTD